MDIRLICATNKNLEENNKTNADLEKFLLSVQDHDSSIRFDESTKDNAFRKLHSRMNDLNTIIQHIKVENERTKHFLQTMVDHVDIGLLSFDSKGRIDICNKAAKRYIPVQRPWKLMSLKTGDNELYEIISNIRPGQEKLYKMRLDRFIQQNKMVRGLD